MRGYGDSTGMVTVVFQTMTVVGCCQPTPTLRRLRRLLFPNTGRSHIIVAVNLQALFKIHVDRGTSERSASDQPTPKVEGAMGLKQTFSTRIDDILPSARVIAKCPSSHAPLRRREHPRHERLRRTAPPAIRVVDRCAIQMLPKAMGSSARCAIRRAA